jgi:ankyrin repeat protein
VRILLDHGADINDRFGLYGSALEAAAHVGATSMTGVLLERRAEINDEVYFSALQTARGNKHMDCIEVLLAKMNRYG